MATSPRALVRGLVPGGVATPFRDRRRRVSVLRFIVLFMEETLWLGDAEIKQEGQLGLAGRAILRELYLSLGEHDRARTQDGADLFRRLADMGSSWFAATPRPPPEKVIRGCPRPQLERPFC